MKVKDKKQKLMFSKRESTTGLTISATMSIISEATINVIKLTHIATGVKNKFR